MESRQEQENDGCYRLISDLIADYAYAFRVDPSGTITCEQMTESLSRITGFTAEELDTHGDYTHLAHPDDLPVLRQRNEKLLSGQRDVSEFRIITKGGETRWLRDQGCPVWDDVQRCVVRIVGAGQDITERVEAENRFQESKRQLESQERFISRVMESIPSSLVVVDPALRIVSVNRNFLGKMRRDEQTTLGFRFTQVFPKALLDYTRLDQKIETVFRTGQMMEGGTVSYRAPGLPTRIYYYRLVPLKGAEAVNNVLLLMDDITEQEQLRAEVRRVERHLASIVECANDMVVSMDPDGRVVTWNRAAEKASGLEAEHVQHKPLLALCAVEQRPMMAQMLQRLARGEEVQATEIDLLTADNRQLPIAWSCSSMRNDANEVIGIVAVGHDLTERRSLEAQLIQSAKMASLGVMAGGIAHELRNPLGIISAGAQLLLERPDDTVLRGEAAQKIYAATQRASLIIENLLTFARPQSEQMTRVNLHAVLEETFALLGHQLTLQTIALHKEFQPDLPPTQGNPHLLQQVFTNLMLNARSAMPGGGMLTVSTCVAQGEQVEVRFRDTGVGIPAENMHQIFDPFFTTMPVGKGIGLGLSISYSIVQQHGGAIQVESQIDQGTTFIVRLPACPR